MKLTGAKKLFGKVAAAVLFVGAAAFVAPAPAQAQQFAIGVQFGAPVYPHYAGFYERERIERERAEIARQEAWQRHLAWEQHERWEREHAFYRDRVPYGYAAPDGYNAGWRR